MSDDQDSRFKFQQKDQLQNVTVTKSKYINDKNKVNSFGTNNIDLIGMNYLGQRSHEVSQMQNSRLNTSQATQIQKQKDRQLRKLTNINKHLLQQLKQQNQQLTQKVSKQRFKFPKKSVNTQKFKKTQQNTKQLQALKRQLQNAYRQIQFYKQNIKILKAKEIPVDSMDKLNQATARLNQKNNLIQKLQNQLKTQKAIKQNQDKQLGKINSPQMIQLIKKLDTDIQSSKNTLKQAKKNLTRRQQLEKRQHMYYLQIQALIKRTKNQAQRQELSQKKLLENPIPVPLQQQVTENQWREVKEKLAQEKKKYQQYGKKVNYYIFLKSKENKLSQQIQLKYKQKLKTLQKLKSKLHQVNKLARLRPKPQIMERVDLKMQKLKDIISRQSSIQITNPSRHRVQSEDVRQFKRWELQHASQQNKDSQQNQNADKLGNIKNHVVGRKNNYDSEDYMESNPNNTSELQVL